MSTAADSLTRPKTERPMRMAMKMEQMGSAIIQSNAHIRMAETITPTLPTDEKNKIKESAQACQIATPLLVLDNTEMVAETFDIEYRNRRNVKKRKFG